MVKLSPQACALVGRLATPAPERLGGRVEDKAKDFFREVCRWIPWTINNYKLDELTTAQELRSNLSFMFKQQAHIKNPRVVDILIYKGREELEIATFMNEPAARKKELERMGASTISPFLDDFYQNKQNV